MKQILLLILASLVLCVPAEAAKGRTEKEVLNVPPVVYKVGVCQAVPYVRLNYGTISGATAFLWKEVADTMKLEYRYVRYPSVSTMTAGLAKGDVDIIITPGTVTRLRVQNYAVSVPFMTTRPGVLMKASRNYPILHVLENMFSVQHIKFILPLVFLMLLFASLIWLVERKANPDSFHHGFRGIFDGVWWAVITMTTVGYGDTVPKTRLGKSITILWTFFAIGLLFLITSEIASELTIAKFQSHTVLIKDLSKIKTATMDGSGYAEGLTVNEVKFSTVDSVSEGFKGVVTGKYDAFVFDMNILKASLKEFGKEDEFEVLPCDLNTQYLCFTGNREMRPLFSRMDPVILQIIQSLAWKEVLQEYDIPQ